MAIALCALLCFGITTIWVEGRWAVSILEAAVFLLSGAALLRGGAQASRAGERWALWIPAAVAVWGSVQLALGWTVALADTEWAMLYWLAAACFLWLGTLVEDRERFLNGLLWFSAAMSALALAQLNSRHGKLLWVIPTGRDERTFGTFLNYDNYAAFIELVFPLAVWRTLENHRHWWLYAGMASLLYGSVIASTSRAGAVLVTLELAAV